MSLEYRPEGSRLSYSCQTAEPLCMQIIRSYVKNACPKSQCTALSWLPKIAPVALRPTIVLYPFLGLRRKPERVCWLASRFTRRAGRAGYRGACS